MKDSLVSIFIVLLLCNELACGREIGYCTAANKKGEQRFISELCEPLKSEEKLAFELGILSGYTELPLLCKVEKVQKSLQGKSRIVGFLWGFLWSPYTVSPLGILNLQGGGKFEIKLPLVTYRQWLGATIQKISTILPDNAPLLCTCYVNAHSSYIKYGTYNLSNEEQFDKCMYNCMQQF